MWKPLRTLLEFILRDTRASMMAVVAVAMVPALAALGAALEYSRGTYEKSLLQNRVDSAILMIGRDVLADSRTNIQEKAVTYIKPLYKGEKFQNFSVSATQSGPRITLNSSFDMNLVMGGVIGNRTLRIAGRAEIEIGATGALEIAMALDTTTSMNGNRIRELKRSATMFLDKAEQEAANRDGIQIALVPFGHYVRVDPQTFRREWLQSAPPANWTGCIGDRDEPYNVSNAAPRLGAPETQFPIPASPRFGPCDLGMVMPLNSNFAAMRQYVAGLELYSGTNITIGAAHAWMTLTEGAPYQDYSGVRKAAKKHLILITDGSNNADRFTENQTELDKKTTQVCDGIRNSGIELYVVNIIEGVESLLKECASRPDYYFHVKKAEELEGVFSKIFEVITQKDKRLVLKK